MEDELFEYYESIGEKIRILSEDEKERIWNGVGKKYIVPKKRKISYKNIGRSVYDSLEPEVGTNDPDACNWTVDFIKNDKIIVFFNNDCGGNFFEIENGSTFIHFLENAFANMDFYVTDQDTSFMFGYCGEVHFLIAMGTAAEWMRNDERYKKAEHPQD